MAVLTPTTAKGRTQFEKGVPFRTGDDRADNQDASAYVHDPIEYSGQEKDEQNSYAFYLQLLLQAGRLSLLIRNNSGGTINAAQLVYISGYDVSNSRFEITKAKSNAATTLAHFVLQANLATATNGIVYALDEISSLNTNGRTVNDPVYLDPSTAGAFTFTKPSGSNIPQIVGRVTKVDASTGKIQFILRGLQEFLIENLVATANIRDLAITTAKLAALAVTTAKIAALAVTAAKLGALSVETAKINALAVTAAKLATDSVETVKIKDANVTAAKLATDSVETAKIKDLNVTNGKIAEGAVSDTKLADNAVTGVKLADAVSDLIVQQANLSVEDEGTPIANARRFTIQVQDSEGNNVAQRVVIGVWLSTADFGAPSGSIDSTNITSGSGFIVDDGVPTARMIHIMTSTSGRARPYFVKTGSGTLYLMCAVGPTVKSLVTTWT